MSRSEHYHVGIVVPDLVVGRAHFTDPTVAPYLELIEEMPGTEWECNEYSYLHHIGFCPMWCEIQQAYNRDPLGVRLELVSETQREMIEQFLCAPTTGIQP